MPFDGQQSVEGGPVRVNVDSSVITDPRFKLLAKRLGISLREAIGSCLFVWMTCYERRTKTLETMEVDAAAEIDGFADALIGVTLAHLDARGRVVLHGVEARIRFLKEQSAKGSKGGKNRRKSSASSQVTSEANAKHMLSEKPEVAQAYSLTLPLAPSLPLALPLFEEEDTAAEPPPRDSEPKPTRKIFTPPTLEDVTAYCRERGNSVDPKRWIDHYTSNGWKVGKNPMKDWRAAVRTWEGNNFHPKPQTRNSDAGTRYRYDPARDLAGSSEEIHESGGHG